MGQPLTVAFDAGHLQERGTDVALYDYAQYNETLLGNRSIILCPADAEIFALDKFRARFTVLLYLNRTDLEWLLRDVDLYYRIAHGDRPLEIEPSPPHGKLAIHCVFHAGQPYGDIYAAVSPWVAEHHGDKAVRVVPHIIDLPDEPGDLRQELGIPISATVLGRHGGMDTFNIPFVHDVIRDVITRREDLWFVFLNTRPFIDHPRVRFLDRTADMNLKTRFINSCDGMMHARAEGETFGISVGEFSIRNKPVITYLNGSDNHHVDVLGERGFYYRSPEELLNMLLAWRAMPGDWDQFSQHFSPEVVMRAFDDVFLSWARRPALTGQL